jgi:N-sulfoglucosamine sulfohydrolase
MKNFIIFCGISGLFWSGFKTESGQSEPKQPNIIWLNIEDLSPHLGCYGDSTVPTPNIDRLAREGVRYTNVFTTAGVCAPSRNAIATGRIQTSNGGHNMRTLNNTYPEKTGLPKEYSVVMPPDVKHFAELLRKEGYYTINNVKNDYQFEEPLTVWDESSAKADYLNRKPNQPFFAMLNCTITHESMVWANAKKPLRVSPDKVKVPPYYPDTDSVRLDIARFYTNISEMDDWVGMQIKKLEDNNLLENTIVMFWTDHGDGLPFVKREIYHRGLKVPFIIRFPHKKEAGKVDNQLISAIDWAPTVLSLANIPTPKFMQGKAFLGGFKRKIQNKYIFAARDRMDSEYDRVRAVSDGKFEYIHNFNPEKPLYMNVDFRKQQASMREILRLRDAGKLDEIQMKWFTKTKSVEEFYDTQTDPNQFNNLASNPLYAKKLNEFRKVFKNWQTEVFDYGSISEKEMIKQMWNGNNTPPITANPQIETINGLNQISCSTEGASIAYKIIEENKPEPIRWEVYSKPIPLNPHEKIKAVAKRIGYKQSEMITQK